MEQNSNESYSERASVEQFIQTALNLAIDSSARMKFEGGDDVEIIRTGHDIFTIRKYSDMTQANDATSKQIIELFKI